MELNSRTYLEKSALAKANVFSILQVHFGRQYHTACGHEPKKSKNLSTHNNAVYKKTKQKIHELSTKEEICCFLLVSVGSIQIFNMNIFAIICAFDFHSGFLFRQCCRSCSIWRLSLSVAFIAVWFQLFFNFLVSNFYNREVGLIMGLSKHLQNLLTILISFPLGLFRILVLSWMTKNHHSS